MSTKPSGAQRSAALVFEIFTFPGMGLFCSGEKRWAFIHAALAFVILALLVGGAVLGSLSIYWAGMAIAVLRVLAAVVQVVRARTKAAAWKGVRRRRARLVRFRALPSVGSDP